PGHGTLVSLDMANGEKVQGYVVRFDLSSNEVFMRTKPGALPVAYHGNNVKKLLVGWQQTAAGKPQMVVRPEIHTQVIYNGTQRSVAYSSGVLSREERELLARLQKVENHCAALAYQSEQRDAAIAQDVALQAEQVRTQRLINDTLRNENNINY